MAYFRCFFFLSHLSSVSFVSVILCSESFLSVLPVFLILCSCVACVLYSLFLCCLCYVSFVPVLPVFCILSFCVACLMCPFSCVTVLCVLCSCVSILCFICSCVACVQCPLVHCYLGYVSFFPASPVFDVH